MILGTFGAGYFAYHYGLWAGVARRDRCSARSAGCCTRSPPCVFGVDHIVSGVAINIIAARRRRSSSPRLLHRPAGGGPTQSPPLDRRPDDRHPGISDAGEHARGQALVPGLRPGRRRGGADHEPVARYDPGRAAADLRHVWVLWRTPFGLRLRSCGESPAAAETLGVNVYRYKYIAVLISGAFAGLGGAFLALVASGGYHDGQTGGRGYIGLAAMIFGNWRPGGLLLGRRLFGYTDALPAAQRRRVGARAAAARGRDPAAGVGAAASSAAASAGRAGTWSRSSLRFLVWYLAHRRGPARLHRDDAVRRDAAGARLRLAATADARGRRPGLSQGLGAGDVPRPTDVDWDALTARGRRGDAHAPTRRTPTSRSAPPGWSTTAGVVVGLQRRERGVRRRRCAPSADGLPAARHRRRPADPVGLRRTATAR